MAPGASYMADRSKIGWTDATWNPVTGCSVISPGCTNCYAMRLAGGRLKNHPSRAGLTQPSKTGPVWNGKVRFNDAWLEQPMDWSKPRRIFVVAHGDLFHPNVPDEWIDRTHSIMAHCPQHIFQVLTKRPDRMRDYYRAASQRIVGDTEIPFKNVWRGVSAEDEPRAEERLPILIDTLAAVRFVSLEPLLEYVDLSPWLPGLDWVIIGGESGPHARPFELNWARRIISQCQAAGVAVFMKQIGANVWASGGTDFLMTAYPPRQASHGDDPDEWPDDLRIQQYPDLETGEPGPNLLAQPQKETRLWA